MNEPMDNRSPTQDPYQQDVWIWTDGQVGGPFPLKDVEALVASGEAPPGLLARAEGGDWMPWPAFADQVRQAQVEPEPQPSYSMPDTLFAAEYLAVAFVLLLIGLGITVAITSDRAAAAALSVIASTILGLAAYFFPTAVAVKRDHRQRLAIIVLNLVGGWTVVGWIVALVWACTETSKRPEGPAD